MELMISFIIGLISSIIDKIKDHFSTANRKSGLEFELKFKFKLNK